MMIRATVESLSGLLLLPLLLTAAVGPATAAPRPAGSRADAPAAPQDRDPAGSPPPATFEDELAVSWVLVPVVVVTSGGDHVRGLDRRSFRLRVDGRRVPVDHVDQGGDVPLSVVYLQDLSGSMANAGKLQTSRRAFGAFLDALRGEDEISLASFAGDRVTVEVPFTDDRQTLAEAMAAWEGYGTTALHDAAALLPEISMEGTRGKRVAVLVTDGLDNSSRLTPDEALELVRIARLPVYVIGLSAYRRENAPTARAGREEVYRYADLLRTLAEATGGRFFDLAGPEELADIGDTMAAVLDDLRLRHILSIATAGDGPRSYRRIEVELAPGVDAGRWGRQITLRHRRGYWGTEPRAFRSSRSSTD